jgi:hypothetical protein
MEQYEIAANLLAGKICDTCIHKTSSLINNCMSLLKPGLQLSEKKTCENWWGAVNEKI